MLSYLVYGALEWWEKCVKCSSRGLGMTNTEKVRLVQEDKMGWWEMCGVQKVLVKTNTEKVRTNMERVRLVQKDWHWWLEVRFIL